MHACLQFDEKSTQTVRLEKRERERERERCENVCQLGEWLLLYTTAKSVNQLLFSDAAVDADADGQVVVVVMMPCLY